MFKNSQFKLVILAVCLLFSKQAVADSLTLMEAYKASLISNNSVLSKQSMLQADSEELEQAWSRVLPNVTVNASVGKGRYDTSFVKDENESISRASIRVTQPVFSLSRFRGINRAELTVARYAAEFDMELYGVALETTQAYLDVLSFKNEAAIAEQQTEDHLIRIQRLEAMLERGLATRVDLLETRSRYDESQAKSIQANNNYKVAVKKLEQLIGANKVDVIEIDEALWQQSKALLSESISWPDLALENSYTIKMAQRRLDESKSDISVREADYWPEVSLTAEYGKFESYENSIEKNAKVQLELSMPLYQGGQTSSAVRASKDRARSNVYYLEDRKHFVTLKTEEVVTTIKDSYENILAYQATLESSNAYLESAEKGLKYGIRGMYDVLEAKTRLFDAQSRLNFEIYKNIKSQLELLFLTSAFGEAEMQSFLEGRYAAYMQQTK